MAIQLVPVGSQEKSIGADFSARSADLAAFGERASPVVTLDHFRISAPVFGPHPHAGFSAVSYVLEDSPGSLRSRDTLGNDIVMGPGGIVWSQAGSGMMHEEVPAETGRELRGFQIFVNLSSKNKSVAPRVFALAAGEVPEWRSGSGDRVRVVVGSFEGLSSPLVPAEAFDLFDVELRREISFDLKVGCNALVYVLAGEVVAGAGAQQEKVAREHALALHSGHGRATFGSPDGARFLILSGADIREPVVTNGPFIMNDASQIDAALARYRAGTMGRLAPLSES